MQFTVEELNELVNIDQPAAKRILKVHNLKIEDFVGCQWNQQELAMRIGDDSLFEKCLQHMVSYVDQDLFKFVYQYIDIDFIYNCLQMIPCYSCYVHTDYEESINLREQCESKYSNRIFYYQFKKIYDLTLMQIQFKENSEQHIKGIRIHIPNGLTTLKDFKASETISFIQQFKPALTVQAIGIEFVLNDSDKMGSCGCSLRRELDESKMFCTKCNENLFFNNIVLTGCPTVDGSKIVVQNESQIQIVKNIISEAAILNQSKGANLQKCYNELQLLQQGLMNGRESIISEMLQLYREFNQSAIIVQNYSEIVKQFYKIPRNVELSRFSDCVECSRRMLNSASQVDNRLLRKLYFSSNVTHKERMSAIKLMVPSIVYNNSDLDKEQSEEWLSEFELQCDLYLMGNNSLVFLKDMMNGCVNNQLIVPLVKMLNHLNDVVSKQGCKVIYELLNIMEIENIALGDNMFSQLFLIADIQVQQASSELLYCISQHDDMLAINILFATLMDANSPQYYLTLQKIEVNKAAHQMCVHLMNFILNNHRTIEPTKLQECYQLILRSWKQLGQEQNQIYIKLDSIYYYLNQRAMVEDSLELTYVLNAHQLLYQGLQVSDNLHILEYFINQMLENTANIQQIQRITQMMHNIIFKKLEFKIKTTANRATEEYVQKKHVEYNSIDFDNFEQLKIRMKKDLQIDMEFDLLVQNRLIDDTLKNIELVYKNFYLNEISRSDKNNLKVLSFSRNEEESLQFNPKKKIKDLLSLRTLPTMLIEFSIRGIGGHDDMPYLPQLIDEAKEKQQSHFIGLIESKNLRSIFKILQSMINEKQKYITTITNIVDILKYISASNSIRQEILNCSGLVLLLKIFLFDTSNETILDFLQELLAQVQSIPNLRRRFSDQIDQVELAQQDKESQQNLQLVLKQLEMTQNDKLIQTLCQIIPLIIRDQCEPAIYLLNHFQSHILFGEQISGNKLNIFSLIMYYNPKHYIQLRNQTISFGVYQSSLQYFTKYKGQLESESFSDLVSEQIAMSLMIVFSIAKNNLECQMQLLDQEVVQFAFKMASNPGLRYKNVSRVCDNFIQYLKEEDIYIVPDVRQEVEQLIIQKDIQFKQFTASKRSQIMKKFQNSKYDSKLSQLQDEKGLQCISCKEGYTTNQNLLGIYIYSIPYQIPDEKVFLQSNGTQVAEVVGIQSVTYFTVMHLNCHRKTVEYAIKQYHKDHEDAPRPAEEIEWECATKNNVAKCNNFFPIRHTNINIDQGLDLYLRRSEKLYKVRVASKTWLMINDLKGLILRMARQDDLANDTGAGRYEHNIKLIPFYLYAILQQDITPYLNLPQIYTENTELWSIGLITSLFRPFSEYIQVKQKLLNALTSESYFVSAVYLVDLIMTRIFKSLKDTKHNEQLENLLNKDQLKITEQFEQVEQIFTKNAKNITIQSMK